MVFGAAAIITALSVWPVTPVVILLWAAFLAFFRDPQRRIPTRPEALLSPADGTVRDVEQVEGDGEFIGGPAMRVGIFMSVLNVHVNRSPADGAVRYERYSPGRFHDARHPAASEENERNAIGLELEGGRRIMVTQIAGAVARRIVCQAHPDQSLKAGQRYGMVKFGSRVELLLPLGDQWEVVAKPGDKVRAGVDVLAVPAGHATDR